MGSNPVRSVFSLDNLIFLPDNLIARSISGLIGHHRIDINDAVFLFDFYMYATGILILQPLIGKKIKSKIRFKKKSGTFSMPFKVRSRPFA